MSKPPASRPSTCGAIWKRPAITPFWSPWSRSAAAARSRSGPGRPCRTGPAGAGCRPLALSSRTTFLPERPKSAWPLAVAAVDRREHRLGRLFAVRRRGAAIRRRGRFRRRSSPSSSPRSRVVAAAQHAGDQQQDDDDDDRGAGDQRPQRALVLGKLEPGEAGFFGGRRRAAGVAGFGAAAASAAGFGAGGGGARLGLGRRGAGGSGGFASTAASLVEPGERVLDLGAHVVDADAHQRARCRRSPLRAGRAGAVSPSGPGSGRRRARRAPSFTLARTSSTLMPVSAAMSS